MLPVANIFDVLWDGSVSPYAMFVHEGDELRLLEVVRRFGRLFVDPEVGDLEVGALVHGGGHLRTLRVEAH